MLAALHSADLALMLAANRLVGLRDSLDVLFRVFNHNTVWMGGPILFSLVYLWFSDGARHRAAVARGLGAVIVATTLSVFLQSTLHVHLRPLTDPALAPQLRLGNLHLQEIWCHKNSFPSDTATLYFSAAAVVALESLPLGLLSLFWAAISGGLVRIACGWHYPSDSLGGILLGAGLVWLASRSARLTEWTARAIRLAEKREPLLHAALFLFLADLSTRFAGLQAVAKGVQLLLHL